MLFVHELMATIHPKNRLAHDRLNQSGLPVASDNNLL